MAAFDPAGQAWAGGDAGIGGYGAGGGASDTPALNKERLLRLRSVFTPGHRIRMNVVPMFLGMFAPWGLFILINGVSAFSLMYTKPFMAWLVIFGCFGIAAVCCAISVYARVYMPGPTWYSYMAIMTVLACVLGFLSGQANYYQNSLPYFQISDLKVLGHIDVAKDMGQQDMDAGVFYFAAGNKIDVGRSWHFKHRHVYCVAPITGNPDPPSSLSYDFWAVGKDCCSMSSSDFRCGAYSNAKARSGIRVLDAEDTPYYRLAVQQTETLYGIASTHPIFVEWVEDPLSTVNHWNERAFVVYLESVAFFFCVCLFAIVFAVSKYAFIGRGGSADEGEMDDPYMKYGYAGAYGKNRQGFGQYQQRPPMYGGQQQW